MPSTRRPGHQLMKELRRNYQLLLIFLVPLVYYIVFHYLPMGGVILSFKKYNPRQGIWGSRWVGLKYYKMFLPDPYFWKVVRNTFMLNFYSLLFGFPIPILFALLLNEMRTQSYKKLVQSISYVPHFISIVVVCGMVIKFCAIKGLINDILSFFGLERTAFLQDPAYFRTIFVLTNIWKEMGWNAIIYVAALTAVDLDLYEAADIEGANRLQRAWHITLPGIAPTIVIMLILRVGNLLTLGHETILLLYNSMTYETADVISTYVYRRGFVNADYSYGTAVGLFNSVVALVLVSSANYASRKIGYTSLW